MAIAILTATLIAAGAALFIAAIEASRGQPKCKIS